MKLAAALTYVLVGLVGLILCIRFVLSSLGVVAALAAIILFPLTLALVPWIALLGDAAWTPFLVVYGGLFAAGVLHAIARGLERGAVAEGRRGDTDADAGVGDGGPLGE